LSVESTLDLESLLGDLKTAISGASGFVPPAPRLSSNFGKKGSHGNKPSSRPPTQATARAYKPSVSHQDHIPEMEEDNQMDSFEPNLMEDDPLDADTDLGVDGAQNAKRQQHAYVNNSGGVSSDKRSIEKRALEIPDADTVMQQEEEMKAHLAKTTKKLKVTLPAKKPAAISGDLSLSGIGFAGDGYLDTAGGPAEGTAPLLAALSEGSSSGAIDPRY